MPKNKTKKDKEPAKSPEEEGVSKEGRKKKKSKKVNQNSFTGYVKKVTRKVHGDTGNTEDALKTLDSFVSNFVMDVTRNASELTAQKGKTTLDSDIMAAAIQLVIPDSDFNSAMIDYATAASDKYNASLAESQQVH